MGISKPVAKFPKGEFSPVPAPIPGRYQESTQELSDLSRVSHRRGNNRTKDPITGTERGVWITKYRRPALQGEIAIRVRDLIRDICGQHEVSIMKGHGSNLLHHRIHDLPLSGSRAQNILAELDKHNYH
jgi:hypothetical protein